MTPSKDQINLARRIIEAKGYTDHEIRRKMEKLVEIRKGEGHPMYESFKIILTERSMKK